jgi:aromatic-L-amino-acid decarboxylase
MNERFSAKLSELDQVVLPLEPFLNFTCFRLQPRGMEKPEELNALNEAFLEKINRDGKLFLTHTKIDGLHTTRMIIGQTYVGGDHVDLALEQIISAAEISLKEWSP